MDGAPGLISEAKVKSECPEKGIKIKKYILFL